MKRENCTPEGTIKEFKNGNINVKASPETVTAILEGTTAAYVALYYLLDSLDCYFVGDPGCFGNDEMCQTVYCANNGNVYNVLLYRDVERDFAQGKTVKLYAHIPTETERENINAWYEN